MRIVSVAPTPELGSTPQVPDELWDSPEVNAVVAHNERTRAAARVVAAAGVAARSQVFDRGPVQSVTSPVAGEADQQFSDGDTAFWAPSDPAEIADRQTAARNVVKDPVRFGSLRARVRAKLVSILFGEPRIPADEAEAMQLNSAADATREVEYGLTLRAKTMTRDDRLGQLVQRDTPNAMRTARIAAGSNPDGTNAGGGLPKRGAKLSTEQSVTLRPGNVVSMLDHPGFLEQPYRTYRPGRHTRKDVVVARQGDKYRRPAA